MTPQHASSRTRKRLSEIDQIIDCQGFKSSLLHPALSVERLQAWLKIPSSTATDLESLRLMIRAIYGHAKEATGMDWDRELVQADYSVPGDADRVALRLPRGPIVAMQRLEDLDTRKDFDGRIEALPYGFVLLSLFEVPRTKPWKIRVHYEGGADDRSHPAWIQSMLTHATMLYENHPDTQRCPAMPKLYQLVPSRSL